MSKTKKVLYCTNVYPPDSGGVAAFAKDIVDLLKNYGFSVNLFYEKPRTSGSRIKDYPKLFFTYFLLFIKVLKYRPKIIICSTALPFLPALVLFKKVFGFKLFVQVMGTEIRGIYNKGKRKRFLQYLYDHTDEIWPISNFTKNLLINFGCKKDKIRVFYPFVTDKMIDLSKEYVNLEKFKKFTIFTSAHLYPRKGIDLVLKAISELPDADVQYLIAGKAPTEKYEGYYENLATDLGIKDKVNFLGQLERGKLWKKLARSHLFIMHSRANMDDIESFGIVYMEAQLFGLPCIGTDFGGIPEAIGTNEGGILVPDEDIEALKAAISKFYDNEKLREETSRKSRKFVLNNFSAEVRADEVNKIFSELT